MLFFFTSMITGVLLVWSYDIFRVFRKVVPHRSIAVNAEDLLYWFLTALIIFGMIFEQNDGALRGYAFVGILIGVWIQYTVEVFFRTIWRRVLNKLRKKGRMTVKKDK